MRRVFRVTCAVALLAVAGCGGSDDKSDAPIGAVDASRPAPSGEATAEQVAEEMRGNVKCPAKASSPRPDDAPIDDVVGVKPGMSWGARYRTRRYAAVAMPSKSASIRCASTP